MLKLNLGSGFRKHEGFVNVDVLKHVEPDVVIDLTKEAWPWEDSSVAEARFDYSLEEMGQTKDDLFFVIKQLYRVCADEARVEFAFAHPRHDRFYLNPLCTQRLSPGFFQLLSVQRNLQMIPQGQGDTCLGMMLGVDFVTNNVKFLIEDRFREVMEAGRISEQEIRDRMALENNICAAVEVSLTVQKKLPRWT